MGKRKHNHPNSSHFEMETTPIVEIPNLKAQMDAKEAPRAAGGASERMAAGPADDGSLLGSVARRIAGGVEQAVSLGRAALDFWRHRHDAPRSQ
jgi:delta 1-pyrroline-5-carboxylate dehydrogenase